MRSKKKLKIVRRSIRSFIVILQFVPTASAVKQQTEITESNLNGRFWSEERTFTLVSEKEMSDLLSR